MAAAEPHWRALEAGYNLSTPYQRFDLLNLWQRHIGTTAGVTPFIVMGFNAGGSPLFLWPLGRRMVGWHARWWNFSAASTRISTWALWRRDVIGSIGADDLRAALARLAGRADLLRLTNQPLTWGGTTNPFALLPQQRSANFGFSGALDPRFRRLAARPHQLRHPQEDAQEGARARQLRRGAFRAAARAGRRAPHARRLLQAEERAHARCSALPMPSRRRACAVSSKPPQPSGCRRRAADRDLCALGRRHRRRDLWRHRRRRPLLRHVQFDHPGPLRGGKPGRAIAGAAGATLLRARARHVSISASARRTTRTCSATTPSRCSTVICR